MNIERTFFQSDCLREAYHYPAESRRLFIEMNIIAKAAANIKPCGASGENLLSSVPGEANPAACVELLGI